MHAREYQPGEQVPGTVYKVVRLIGAGGMGTVYDVEDTTIAKRYVLKTLHPQLGAREDLARRMQNEARTLARLNHPNIVEVFTAGVTADDLRLPYYVMERLNGQSLRVILEKKGQIDLQHAYHIAIDLLDALDHAHDKGVIHRDVKPDNIFLHRMPSGVTLTKLLDFGIVSMLDSVSRETAGRFLGTLRYAAPEQLRGEKPTAKTDVYAAGLVLYETIAGRGPFDDEGDPHKIGAAHLNKVPPPISRFVAVPRELEALIMAALDKHEGGRPRDAFSFAASLRNLKRNRTPAVRDQTENRLTLPASTGQSSQASHFEVRVRSENGAYVIAPGSPVQVRPNSPVEVPPSRVATVTLAGMSPAEGSTTSGPQDGMNFAGRSTGATTATSADPIDRVGLTGSIGPETVRLPQDGTDAMSEHGARIVGQDFPHSRTHGGGRGPLDSVGWSGERASCSSEAPQVRSLHAVSVAPLRWRAVRTFGLVAAAIASASLVFLLIRGASQVEKTSTHQAEMLPAVALPLPPPSAAPPAFTARTLNDNPPDSELSKPDSALVPAQVSPQGAELPSLSPRAPLSIATTAALPASGASGSKMATFKSALGAASSRAEPALSATAPRPSPAAGPSTRAVFPMEPPHPLADRPGPGF